MEHAAAGMTTVAVPEERRLPEAGLNGMILRWAFTDKAISGFGALALAWATIVLLGGFSTLIKQKDFWFVTIISFLEATRLGICMQNSNIYLPIIPTNVSNRIDIVSLLVVLTPDGSGSHTSKD